MNWSHALLVMAFLSGVAGIFTSAQAAEDSTYKTGSKFARNWMIALFIITVISGALAAGLWR